MISGIRGMAARSAAKDTGIDYLDSLREKDGGNHGQLHGTGDINAPGRKFKLPARSHL